MIRWILPALAVLLITAEAHGEVALQSSTANKPYYFCADAESFAIKPTDFSRITALNGEGRGFADVLASIGKPVLRLASMQRWDWRGEAQSAALVSSKFIQRPRNALGYRYFSAKQYYDFAKAYGVSTVPMLDARYFYDETDETVKDTADNIEKAAEQYAAGYARFIKDGDYDVAFWEIGNEDYTKALNYRPEKYAKVVKGFIKAVLEVDPNARFCIQINTWDAYHRNWSAAVLSALKGYERHIDYAAVHYYNPVDYTDGITDEIITFLRERGFFKTKLAITEWRHSSQPDEYDRTFRSAAVYSRYLLFMLRHDGIEASCVHALPLFGGLAEWSDGRNWTAYSAGLGTIGIQDTLKTPRWRILPFGLAHKMIKDASSARTLTHYSENPGKTSVYLFGGALSRSLIIVNESAVESNDSVVLDSVIARISGTELFSNGIDAKPTETEPQPWLVRPVYIGFRENSLIGSSVVASGKMVTFRLRPYSVLKVDLN